MHYLCRWHEQHVTYDAPTDGGRCARLSTWTVKTDCAIDTTGKHPVEHEFAFDRSKMEFVIKQETGFTVGQ